MEVKTADVTVRFAEPDKAPVVAMIVALPTLNEEAMPFAPCRLLTVTTVAEDELHATWFVKS